MNPVRKILGTNVHNKRWVAKDGTDQEIVDDFQRISREYHNNPQLAKQDGLKRNWKSIEKKSIKKDGYAYYDM